MTHYVYLLRCADNSLYVGETSDLATRERHHNEGRGGSYTAKRRPVHIVTPTSTVREKRPLGANGAQ